MRKWNLDNPPAAAMACAIAAALLLWTGVALADKSGPVSDEAPAALYSGMWHGTIHLGDVPMLPFDRQVFLELGEDGTFYCPTHDLVTLKEDSPSVGWVKWEGDSIDFVMDTALGEERHSFQFFHVPREQRNDRIPPKLYLHDIDSDIHVHLTPVPITPARR